MANKNKVYESYEKIAMWFDEHRSRELFEKHYLDMAMSYLAPGAKILDLGCGMGEPIAKYFIDNGYQLTGVDGSQKLIELAKARFPKNKFIVGDMRELNLKEKYDCIIAWHSFFHLPQDDQRKMFQTFKNYMNQNGVLLFTSGHSSGEVWGDNGGENLYHASLSIEEYQELLVSYGFELITHTVEDENCGGATVWFAKLNDNNLIRASY